MYWWVRFVLVVLGVLVVAAEPVQAQEEFTPVGVWNWTKREFSRDDQLYLTWVYADGSGVARNGGCRSVIEFEWDWDTQLQTLTLNDPAYDGPAELYFRDQQVDRSYGARTVTRTQSLHAPGREIDGLREPEMGDLVTVVPDPFTGLMHWELLDTDTGGEC